jgi:predicted AAA+ superfamily ATPase
MVTGGFPPVDTLRDVAARRDWFSSYVDTYLRRDVRDLSQVGDLGQFNRFLRVLAARSGQTVNASEIGKSVGINYKTSQHWASLVETTGLWRELPPYFENTEKRVVKRPKGYFTDTGLLCFLVGIDEATSLERSPLLGAIFETFVIGEIWKIAAATGTLRNLYFFGDQQGEVDLVIDHGGTLIPIEIKLSATWSHSFAHGLRRLAATYPKRTAKHGYVLTLGPELIERERGVSNLPLEAAVGNLP